MTRFGLDAETLLARRPELHRRVLVGERLDRPGRDGGRVSPASSARPADCPSRPATPTVHRPRSASRPTTGAGTRSRSACSPRCCIGRAPARVSTSTWRRGRSSPPARPTRSSPTSSGSPGPIRVGNAPPRLRTARRVPRRRRRRLGRDRGRRRDPSGRACARCSSATSWVPRYPNADARRAARREIDDAIGAWTRQRSSREAFEVLQAAGVPAMAVMTNESLATDPHLARARRLRRHRPPRARSHARHAPAVAVLRPRRRDHATDR